MRESSRAQTEPEIRPESRVCKRGVGSLLSWVDISILLLALGLRVVLLEIKPAHFDEGVNGWFADQMTRTGFYRYDPANFHGPLHFYAVFLSQTLFGRSLWALRLPVIVASLLTVWAMLRYREFFGSITVRLAAVAMAVSPACVFYGRYSIHESWMMLFQVLFLWGVLGMWQKGERRFLFTAVFAAAGMMLTKETYILHLGCFLLAAGVLRALERVLPSQPAPCVASRLWTGRDKALACGLGLLMIVFFYSGTFLDFSALQGLYQTFGKWLQTGVGKASGHEKDYYTLWGIGRLNYYWLMLMARYEWPALLGLAASLRYLAVADARLRYIAIYAGGVLLAYTLIPYKTPWCILSMLWPFFLLFGAFAEHVFQRFGAWRQWPGLALRAGAAIAVLVSLGVSTHLNFFRFDDSDEPYVYVQTYRESRMLTEPLLGMARLDPRYYHVRGLLLLSSSYPLPWVFGDFTQLTQLTFSSTVEQPAGAIDHDVVVVEKPDVARIESVLAGNYFKRAFRLRSGQEDCVVYFREKRFRALFPGQTAEIKRAQQTKKEARTP